MKSIYITIIISLLCALSLQSQTRTNTCTETNTKTNHHNDVHVDVHIDHSNNHYGGSHHNTETRQHKVSFNSGTLEINGIGDLEVLSTTGSDVIIESEIEDHDHDERSKGLRSLNSAGIDDNTNMGISAVQSGSTLTLTQIGKDCNCNGVKIYVPRSVKISVNHKTVDGEQVKISGIDNEIIISTLYQNIDMENITGPVSVKTVYGGVEADFGTVSQRASISINAVYGLVDVSLPSNTKGNLELSASYGEILSDMNVQVEQNDGMRSLSTTKVKGTINGGGVLISLKSSYENVYLRSK